MDACWLAAQMEAGVSSRLLAALAESYSWNRGRAPRASDDQTWAEADLQVTAMVLEQSVSKLPTVVDPKVRQNIVIGSIRIGRSGLTERICGQGLCFSGPVIIGCSAGCPKAQRA
jgi:hypothetical protein